MATACITYFKKFISTAFFFCTKFCKTNKLLDNIYLDKHSTCIGLVSTAFTFTVEFQESAFLFPPHPGSLQLPDVSDKNSTGF